MRGLLALTLLGALLLAAVPASALPTPGVFCDRSEVLTGRVFPEAMQTNDFVGYEEGLCGIRLLAEAYPDRIEYVKVADSVGWKNQATGAHDTFEVFLVEVTDETSPVPRDEKRKIVFQLSIHGNEKGGREGGLRVIEDFAKGIGLLERRPDLADMLTDTMLVFVFPNPDGWVHEELQYRGACAGYIAVPTPAGCLESQSFVRVNGNGVDLNREYPTHGWQDESHTAMSEPENHVLVQHLLGYRNVVLASDIHGMLQPANVGGGILAFDPQDPHADHVAPPDKGNFVLTMLPAGRQTPDEMATTTALAELIKQRLNSDPYFAEWQAMPRPTGVWGGDFDDWGTVWDTIFYTDSGLTSDWYAQDHGLDAPGVDFELAYNHITFDNYYPGLAQRMNAYHVQTVRVIVESFMDAAREPVHPVIDAVGRDTAVLANPYFATNTDNEGPARGLTGWALENPHDDLYDLAHVDYVARPQAYWEDLAPWVSNGRLDTLTPPELATRLAAYDNLVVAGSAYDTLDEAAKTTVRAWVEAGGTLVATDDALQLLPQWGLADSADAERVYAGYADFLDRSHPLLKDVRGLARQLVEPVPIGYEMGELPTWYVTGGDVEAVGVLGDAERATVGLAPLGAGRVVFIGAFLPDPTEEFYHPYGLDAYATTYTANQILANALGWTTTLGEGAAPQDIDLGAVPAADVPGAGALAGVAALAAVALAARRVSGRR